MPQVSFCRVVIPRGGRESEWLRLTAGGRADARAGHGDNVLGLAILDVPRDGGEGAVREGVWRDVVVD